MSIAQPLNPRLVLNTNRMQVDCICYDLKASRLYLCCLTVFLPPANEVWGKIMFLQASVILLTGGCLLPGGCLLRGRYAPGWVCSGGVLPGGVCSRVESAPGGGSAPGGWCLMEAPGTATAAGGTHPTGMHSCYTNGMLADLY